MYQLLRRILFCFDAEDVHHFAMESLHFFCQFPLLRGWLRKYCAAPAAAPVACFGLSFPNPIGLAAGFDKNAKYLRELETLGFGFVEIGTVTPRPQEGNDRPRLFRLPANKALINRMGFNNEGVKAVAKRLQQWKEQNSSLIIGGNIGKNKTTPNEEAWKDYETCFLALFDWVDYFVVNVSSPNTPGLRALQEKDALRKILSHLQMLNAQRPAPKPILLKIAPDLSNSQLDDVIDLALEIQLNGLLAANTSLDRSGLSSESARKAEQAGAGGLSGAPVEKRATEMIAYIRNRSNNRIPVIGSGGIFTAQEAAAKMKAGACLLQVWTGFIYEGPAIVKKIMKALPAEMARQ